MAATYDFKKIPSLNKGQKESLYHPHIVSSGTIDANTLIEEISKGCTFTAGDLKGALASLSERISRYVSAGYHVELGDIGYFSAKLKALKPITDKDKVRSASVAFDNINFRASAKFKKQLHGDLTRSHIGFHSSKDSELSERKAALLAYLSSHPFITRSDYTKLTGLLKTKAINELKTFTKEGVLVMHGGSNQLIFSLA